MKKRTNISRLRFKYKKNPLDIKNSDSNPFKQFNKWMKESIRNKIFEPTAMSLSTVNKRNKVSNRIVLLKGVVNNSFVFYTNLKSRKSYELNINKNVAAVFWWPQIGKQVRIEGYVKVVNKKEADHYFSTRSRESQIGAWASNQSSELKNRKTLIKRFKIIKKLYRKNNYLIEIPYNEWKKIEPSLKIPITLINNKIHIYLNIKNFDGDLISKKIIKKEVQKKNK